MGGDRDDDELLLMMAAAAQCVLNNAETFCAAIQMLQHTRGLTAAAAAAADAARLHATPCNSIRKTTIK